MAGVLIALVGASNVFWIDAMTFAVSAGIVALLLPSIEIQRPEATTSGLRR